MKFTLALAILQQLPAMMQIAETLFPSLGKGPDKKLTVSSQMVQYEGALALDQQVQLAKSALIDAQVAYANAMAVAAANASALQIPVTPLTTLPPLVPITVGGTAPANVAAHPATHPRATDLTALHTPST